MSTFAIKSKDNGTYYTGTVFIGPKFGGGPVEAVKFDSRAAAAFTSSSFPLVVQFDVVEVYTAPCGDCGTALWVEQVPLLPEAVLTKCPACERPHIVYQHKSKVTAGRLDMAKGPNPPKVGDEVKLRFQDGDPRTRYRCTAAACGWTGMGPEAARGDDDGPICPRPECGEYVEEVGEEPAAEATSS